MIFCNGFIRFVVGNNGKEVLLPLDPRLAENGILQQAASFVPQMFCVTEIYRVLINRYIVFEVQFLLLGLPPV